MEVEKEEEAQRAEGSLELSSSGGSEKMGVQGHQAEGPHNCLPASLSVFHPNMEAFPRSVMDLLNHSPVISIPEADGRMKGHVSLGQTSSLVAEVLPENGTLSAPVCELKGLG